MLVSIHSQVTFSNQIQKGHCCQSPFYSVHQEVSMLNETLPNLYTILDIPYPPTQYPSLLHHPISTKHHKITSPSHLKLSPILQPHSIRHIFRHTPHSFLNRNLSPRHQVPYTFI